MRWPWSKAPVDSPMDGGKTAGCTVHTASMDVRDRPKLKTAKHIVIHRCSLANYDAVANPNPVRIDGDLTAEKLIERFKNKALKTGGHTPYHGLIRCSGMNEQMLPLSVVGSHAQEYNDSSIAWCVVGEKTKLPAWQFESLVRAVSMLVIYTGLPVDAVVGHSDLPGGSADPDKKCPWPCVDMAELREAVASMLPADVASWDTVRRVFYTKRAGFII